MVIESMMGFAASRLVEKLTSPVSTENIDPDFQAGVKCRKEGNISAALKCFEKAANKRIPAASNILGVIYRDGEGVPRSFIKAERHFKRSAGIGISFALALERILSFAFERIRIVSVEGQYNLGLLYEDEEFYAELKRFFPERRCGRGEDLPLDSTLGFNY